MEAKVNFPGVISAEWVVCTMWEALGLGTSLLAEKCLFWLLLETGSLPVHVFQGCQTDTNLPLRLCIKQDRHAEDGDANDGIPQDDDDTPKDDDTHKENYNDNHDNGIEDHHMSGGEGSGNGDEEFEDYSGSYSDGGSDDDDGDKDDDDADDTDMEDYYDDDEEEIDEEYQDDSEDDKSSSEDSTDDNNRYPRLKNARDVYTSEDTFRLFEHERRKTRTLDIDVNRDMDLSARGLEITYEVRKSWQFNRCYTVTALPMDGIVECSCKYFESSGVLCSHAQVALKCLRIDKIPDRYRLQDKNTPPGPAEGVHTLINNQEKCHQSSPDSTDFNRSAGPGRDIKSGFQADEEISDYVDPPLLRHARDVYSLDIFNVFQEEYKKSEYLIAREVDIIIEGELRVHYEVEKTGNYSYFKIPRHAVRAVPNVGTVNCICKKFEETGLLCCHAMVVLDYLCVVNIPRQYILDKFKKDKTVSTVQEIHGPEYPSLRSFWFYQVSHNSFNELIKLPIESKETAGLLEPHLDEWKGMLKAMQKNQDLEVLDGDPPLRNARDVYTSEDTFGLFEHERRKMRTLDIDVKRDLDLSARGLEITYEVGKSWQFNRRYTVTALPMDGIVECSCKYFESSGVLCSHAQLALKCLRIDKIPDCYRLQKDKNKPPGLAEGVQTLIKNEEKCHQSSPDCTNFNRSAAPGRDIISGFQAKEEIRTDYNDPPLLRHARDVYSLAIFNMFQEEYKESEYLIAREVDVIIEGGLRVYYEVEKTGNYNYFKIPRHTVRAFPNDGTVNCICKKFDETGLLCCHAIAVLDYLCIVKIPRRYILPMFQKDKSASTVQVVHGPEYRNLRSFWHYRVLHNSFNELVEMPVESKKTARLLEPHLDESKDILKGMQKNQVLEVVDGDSQLANGKGTGATNELTVEENTSSHNDLNAQSCSTLQEFGNVDQSTIIGGAPSCSSPRINFGTQSDAADN